MYTKLDLFRKPVVSFDPENKTHRRYWAMFLKQQSWANIPIRFALTENVNDIIVMVNRILADYYISKEFKSIMFPQEQSVAKKPQKSSKKPSKKP